MKSYDVIIVGAGSMGMSAGYYLARRGVRTLLIDAFDPPHREGSHHGEPRLIRHAYSGHAVYTGMAIRAHELWNELEERMERKLLIQSGVLNITDTQINSFDERIAEAAKQGVHTEKLNADDIRKRWKGLELPNHFEAMYEPAAGYLCSEACVDSYKALALAHGAELLPHTAVCGITARRGSVVVHTRTAKFHGAKLILTAGAWFSTLAPFISLPVRAVRKTVGWFETGSSDFHAGKFPGFTLHTQEGGYYGFPDIGGAGLKIGRHDTGLEWKPGEPLLPFGSLNEDEGDLRGVLGKYMPAAAGRLSKGTVCKYEMSPDEDFIIDRHPHYPHIVVAGGFSGHGFKFSSVVGEICSQLVLDEASQHDIRPFALSRFAQQASPAPSFA
ncbi:N-methyl-L-tryptophan oxidase [Paenibacillus sp. HJL G12]|uniref:N-methyl-L-tryptophan oxidase n=1 Tax=Paenibacillus dendrobii TaxID=2691084 RepID=A0A7X3IIE0_9BACL|nr:N-methyl-L-tryptophan oxidase [Paenibacillus dendrobii]MWV44523.1 N-methyl-L-tryptophan oxidase [Paenibacillus dendrobii]